MGAQITPPSRPNKTIGVVFNEHRAGTGDPVGTRVELSGFKLRTLVPALLRALLA